MIESVDLLRKNDVRRRTRAMKSKYGASTASVPITTLTFPTPFSGWRKVQCSSFIKE